MRDETEILKIRDSATPELLLQLSDFVVRATFGVPTFYFLILDAENGQVMGKLDLRIGGGDVIDLYVGHLGCTVYPKYRGRQVSVKVVPLVRRLAKMLGLDPIWLTCDPGNVASAMSCERLGAHFVDEVKLPESFTLIEHVGVKRRYRLDINDVYMTAPTEASDECRLVTLFQARIQEATGEGHATLLGSSFLDSEG